MQGADGRALRLPLNVPAFVVADTRLVLIDDQLPLDHSIIMDTQRRVFVRTGLTFDGHYLEMYNAFVQLHAACVPAEWAREEQAQKETLITHEDEKELPSSTSENAIARSFHDIQKIHKINK